MINLPSSFADFNSKTMGLGTPVIIVSPASGPPGTEITITVKNMPPVPKDSDPRLEFYVYLPFVTALGSNNVANNCNDEHCFPLYSFEEIDSDKLAPKTIKFALFSKDNPKATVQGGFQESVCDVQVNEKTIERYGTICTEKDQPVGNYDIKFAWGIQRSGSFDVIKTVTFAVTEKGTQVVQKSEDTDEKLMDQYKNGKITEEQFDAAMQKLGYDEQGLRRAKAIIGMLPHQQGEYSPEQKQAIEEGVLKAEQKAKESSETTNNEPISVGPTDADVRSNETTQKETTPKEEPRPAQKSGCLIATAAYGSELAPQVQMLREIRDNVLFSTDSGTAFMAGFDEFYYAFSPSIADYERQNPIFKDIVKTTITPMLSTLSILQFIHVNSESEILGYGIGIMLLNIGMYFVAPAIVIVKVKKYLKI